MNWDVFNWMTTGAVEPGASVVLDLFMLTGLVFWFVCAAMFLVADKRENIVMQWAQDMSSGVLQKRRITIDPLVPAQKSIEPYSWEPPTYVNRTHDYSVFRDQSFGAEPGFTGNEWVDANTLAWSVLEPMKDTAKRKSVRVDLSLVYQDVELNTDVQACERVLRHLLANAIESTPNTGRMGLDVTLDADKDNVHFTVWDTGQGFTKLELDGLFQPFTSSDSGQSWAYDKRGHGLSMIQNDTHHMGAKLTVISAVSEGSRFTLSVPIQREA